MGEQEKPSWEHIAPELPPGWSVENSGDMDYQQRWATRAADGTVTERGFCGRDYAVEDCWGQFGITRKRYAELIAVERVRALVGPCSISIYRDGSVRIWDTYKAPVGGWSGPTLCDAAWACIQALGGGEYA